MSDGTSLHQEVTGTGFEKRGDSMENILTCILG